MSTPAPRSTIADMIPLRATADADGDSDAYTGALETAIDLIASSGLGYEYLDSTGAAVNGELRALVTEVFLRAPGVYDLVETLLRERHGMAARWSARATHS